MALRVEKLFLFFTLLAIGLTGFRVYHPGSTATGSSAFSYSVLQGSKVSIAGATTVNEFSCFSQETYSEHSATFSINALQNSITFHNVILNVKTESLQCGNDVMNRNLCKTLSAEKYPFIVVEVEEAGTKDGQPLNFSRAVHMTGKVYITLADQRRLQLIDFVAIQNTGNAYHLIGEHNISFSQYDLDPPSALFGLVKVRHYYCKV